MKLHIQLHDYIFVLEIEAATIGTVTQVAIWLIGKYLNWF